ncbi:MAG: hypothetical protein WC749_15835 [Dehalococcoidia bacterium]
MELYDNIALAQFQTKFLALVPESATAVSIDIARAISQDRPPAKDDPPLSGPQLFDQPKLRSIRSDDQ